MNALNKDLTALVKRIEKEDLPKAESDSFRQKFHLMPPVGWLNDPNGLCWYKGSYHVFFQYSPFNAKGGEKFWGHWMSEDLLRWEQQPVFLLPDQQWDIHGVYSGSAYVEDDTMYLYYTGNVKQPGDHDYVLTGREHNTALAISKDGIHVEQKMVLMRNADYPDDLTCHVRDPKVWKQDGKYYMVQGARTKADVGEVLVFESEDKLNWTCINTITTPEKFGYMWECPDLFCVDGQYILAVSPQGVEHEEFRFQNEYSCGYFPIYGDFRGEYSLGEYQELDCGFDFYAQQTFTAPDGRVIAIGWMGMPDAEYTNAGIEEYGWQHCLNVPRELHWDGKQLLAVPIEELKQLRSEMISCQDFTAKYQPAQNGVEILLDELKGEWKLSLGGDAELEYSSGVMTLRFCSEKGLGRTQRKIREEDVNAVRVLGDASSLEIFINNGSKVMSTRYYPEKESAIHFSGKGRMELYYLQNMTMKFLEQTI